MAAAFDKTVYWKGKFSTVLHFDKLNSGTLYLIFYPRERLIYILVESTLLVNYSDCTLSLYFKIGLTRAR